MGLDLTFEELTFLLPDSPAESLLRTLPDALSGCAGDLPGLLRQLETLVPGTGATLPGAIPRFLGRYPERLEVLRFLRPRDLSGPGPQILLVLGGVGSGKTSLLDWISRTALIQGFDVRRADFSGEGPSARAFAADLLGPGSGPGTLTRSPGALPGFLLRLGALGKRTPPAGPVLFLLDDVNRAKESHRTVLRFLLGSLAHFGERTRVVLSFGSKETEGPPALLRSTAVWIPGGFRVLRIPPLEAADAEAIIEAGLRLERRAVPERQVRALDRWARGNPASLIEGLRQLRVRRGWSPPRDRKTPRDSRARQPGPSNPVWNVLNTYLEDLSPSDRKLLGYGALLGASFEESPLSQVLELDGDAGTHTVHRALERAARSTLVRPLGEGRWTFENPGFREYLLEGFEPLPVVCLRLGNWFAEHRPASPALVAGLLARAHEPGTALPWIQRELDRAMRGTIPEEVEEAVDHLRQAFPSSPDSLWVRAPLEIRAGQWLWASGYPRASQAVLSSLLKVLRGSSALRIWARVNLASAMVAVNTSRAEQELRRARRDVSLLPGPLPAALRGALNATGAVLAYQQGRWKASLSQAQRALRQLQGTSEWIWITWATVSRSAAQIHLGPLRDALDASRESRREAVLPRENGRVALEWGNEARIRLAQGDLEGAARALDRGLGLARRHGNVAVLASLITNRVLVDLRARRWAAAQRDLHELEGLTLRFELPIHRGWATFRKAQALCSQRRWKEAVGTLRASRRAMEQVGQWKALPLIRCYEILVAGEVGRVQWALEELRRIGPLLETLDREERPPLAWMKARLLVRLDRLLEGEQVLTNALREARRERNPESVGWLLRGLASLQRRRGLLAEAARTERRAWRSLASAGVHRARPPSPWMEVSHPAPQAWRPPAPSTERSLSTAPSVVGGLVPGAVPSG